MWRALALVALVACGEVAPAGVDGGADATLPDASDASFGFGDTAPIDVVITPPMAPDVGLVDGGGPFPCGNCTCDGRTEYCDDSQGPHAPILGDAASDACSGGWGECRPLPDGCAPANCACLPNSTWGSCGCFRSDAGDGLVAGCFYP
jgi:hypothetical protein